MSEKVAEAMTRTCPGHHQVRRVFLRDTQELSGYSAQAYNRLGADAAQLRQGEDVIEPASGINTKMQSRCRRNSLRMMLDDMSEKQPGP